VRKMRSKSFSARSKKGSNMVEGAVGLMIIITGLIFAGLLLMNSGALIYNQEKIGFVTHSAATYAAALTNAGTRQSDVEAQVSNTMANIGLSGANTSVTIKDISLGAGANAKPAVSVTVAARLPTMLSSSFGNLLPQEIQLTETSVALKPINNVQYLVIMNVVGQKVTVPMINCTGDLPNDGLPAWFTNLVGVTRIR
jgi:hypothetical protein